ncbi:MAG: ASKHA domain-containing protein [Candidatus Promineifilaceae bacterium]
MPTLTVIIGEQTYQRTVTRGVVLGEAIAAMELPLEQPCAGRGSCGKCKVLSEGGMLPPDEIEHAHLTAGELAVGNRLACRARIAGDAQVVLAPVVIYSNKSFRSSNRYKRDRDVPLGLAIDLGSTTVAAFLTMLDNGEVCAGAASLNQQTVFGADVISRLAAADSSGEDARRLQRLALSSINQAIDSLNLGPRIRSRVERVTIVCNPAMHHLLSGLPVAGLAMKPFQPHSTAAVTNAGGLLAGIVPDEARVSLPPLIGGFVGSDALACLTYFGFDTASEPMAAIDLGTNGEVLVTDGSRILTASTAAGPAFEGVNISCGSRAVDGAITEVVLNEDRLKLHTINDEPPVGLTGSGLLSAVFVLREAGAIEANGRITEQSSLPVISLPGRNGRTIRAMPLSTGGDLYISQWDIRELQKAKAAIRASVDILMGRLGLRPGDIRRFILTGSFGGQIDIAAARGLGLIPPVNPQVIENIPNGAGLGAAQFLSDAGFAHALRVAQKAQQIDLDTDAAFIDNYIRAMALDSVS